jgi:hypothetical protein
MIVTAAIPLIAVPLFNFPRSTAAASPAKSEWLDQNLGTFDGYKTVSQALGSLDRCAPKIRPVSIKADPLSSLVASEHHRRFLVWAA